MRLRHPNPGDRDQMVRLARLMHEESWYRDFTFDEARIDAALHQCYTNPDWLALVLEDKDGRIVGFFVGIVTEHFFSTDRYACDLAFYIAPDKRGGMGAIRLLKAYEAWCRIKNVAEIHIGISTDINQERTAQLFQSMGFHSPAMGFRKKVRFS